ncbi:MAG: hypothetical protein IJ518_04900 [Clostridia bacterium]|nr:hypothetical protein [Clostridia bacterium]
MKRVICFALAFCLFCGMLAGCQKEEADGSSATETGQTTEGGNRMDSTTTVPVADADESTTTAANTTEVPGSTTTAHTTKTTAATVDKTMTYITGTSPNGVTVRAPKDENLKVVDAATFGMNPANKDNSDAFMLTLAYAAQAPNSKIVIPKGVYRFSASKAMVLRDATNVVIDGQGSEFIFSTPHLFYTRECETIEWRNLTIDWDWDFYRLANLMKVVNKTGTYIDFELPEVETVDIATLEFGAMNSFDPKTLSAGVANGKEFWNMTPSKVESLGGNKIRVYGLSSQSAMNVGEIYLARNMTYKSHCFETSNSQNVTYRNVTIYSAPGMGFVFSNGTGHVMLKDCTIGLRPGTENKRRLSTRTDCVHALNTSGHIWIEGCDFSFAGDDGTNIHDNVAQVEKRISNTVLNITTTTQFEVGDTLSFLKSDYEPLNVTATITGKAGGQITLDKALPASVQEDCIVVNTRYNSSKYYIANNYYHDGRARGILAQASDGLIENNRFSHTQGASIRIVTDITTGSWSEGTGVDNLIVRNNTFENCNVNNWSPLIEIHANINGERPAYPVMKNITIEGNTFIDFPSALLDITSADKVTFKNNIIKNPTKLANDAGNRGEISAYAASNITISGNTYYASPYMDKNILYFEDSAIKVKNLKAEGNIWKED